MNGLEFVPSTIEAVDGLVRSHLSGLSQPPDSWLEDQLLESVIYGIVRWGERIGYAALGDDTLRSFYVRREYFRVAPAILEQLVEEKAVKRVLVGTHDFPLCALISEWDFEKVMVACWFTDSGSVETASQAVGHALFRTAVGQDAERIRLISGDFFDEVSGGFASLEERIAAGTIFVMEEGENLLGCGIVEKGRLSLGFTSIGMYVNRTYRRRGVARSILIHLKDWAYRNGLKPVAGCWYYNTLSRKSLESAGMAATAIGFEAVLKGKPKLPLRTGNPPGELVE